MKKILSFLWMLFALVKLNAQGTFPVNGSHDVRPEKFAITNATVFTSATNKIEKASLLIDGQEITYVGKRSEERRVGKECRYGWTRWAYKAKTERNDGIGNVR